MGALCSIHEQIPIQARVKATLAPSPQRLHRSCQSTIVDSHQYPATNLKLKQSIIPLRIQPIPPWSESESHCDCREGRGEELRGEKKEWKGLGNVTWRGDVISRLTF